MRIHQDPELLAKVKLVSRHPKIQFHKYGPKAIGPTAHDAKFLHTALMNVARLRFFDRARAVLNADIDELVWTDGETVFDKAKLSPLGFAAFAGEWRFPGRELARWTAHSEHDHVWHDARPCPPKYCIAPRGPLGWLSWEVHRIDLPLKKERFLRQDVGFFHCARVSTDWKPTPRILTQKMDLRHDPRTRALLDRAFSPSDAAGVTTRLSPDRSVLPR